MDAAKHLNSWAHIAFASVELFTPNCTSVIDQEIAQEVIFSYPDR